MKECECKEWKEASAYIGAMDMLAHTHHIEFRCKPMVYCPYCRKKLKGD